MQELTRSLVEAVLGPIQPSCQVCGKRLRFRSYLHNLPRRTGRTYPMRMQDGSREERPVRWLCGGCERRAERHRHPEAAPENASSH